MLKKFFKNSKNHIQEDLNPEEQHKLDERKCRKESTSRITEALLSFAHSSHINELAEIMNYRLDVLTQDISELQLYIASIENLDAPDESDFRKDNAHRIKLSLIYFAHDEERREKLSLFLKYDADTLKTDIDNLDFYIQEMENQKLEYQIRKTARKNHEDEDEAVKKYWKEQFEALKRKYGA